MGKFITIDKDALFDGLENTYGSAVAFDVMRTIESSEVNVIKESETPSQGHGEPSEVKNYAGPIGLVLCNIPLPDINGNAPPLPEEKPITKEYYERQARCQDCLQLETRVSVLEDKLSNLRQTEDFFRVESLALATEKRVEFLFRIIDCFSNIADDFEEVKQKILDVRLMEALKRDEERKRNEQFCKLKTLEIENE